jgi:hypothetical protein
MIAQQSEFSRAKFDKVLIVYRQYGAPAEDAVIVGDTKQLRLSHRNLAPFVVCLDRYG